MSISNASELAGMRAVSEAVANTLRAMRQHAYPGMSTWELDVFGAEMLAQYGARSAPKETYGFPGHTCISVNHAIAHGIPSQAIVLREGDLVNIDVSAEKDGFWADNGGSFVLGEDIHALLPLVQASEDILREAIGQIRGGVKIAAIGRFIETRARERGFRVIRNLAGHGVGRSLHEDPEEILNCYDRFNRQRFRKNSVIALETFIATHSTLASETADGWTLVGNRGGYVAQHEQTLVITDGEPLVLTRGNGFWD